MHPPLARPGAVLVSLFTVIVAINSPLRMIPRESVQLSGRKADFPSLPSLGLSPLGSGYLAPGHVRQ